MTDGENLLVRCFPIGRDELKSMTAAEAKLAKIQRCNAYFVLSYPGGLTEEQEEWLRKSKISAQEDPSKTSAKLPPGVENPAKFPLE